MRRRTGSLLLALAVTFLAAPHILLQAEDRKEDGTGWVPLFNGKDLTGWKIHPRPSDSIVEVIPKKEDGKVVAFEGKLKDGKVVPLWRVEDGVLIGSGPASHLYSERGDYTDFDYRVEAMINDRGNSGQYFRTAFVSGFPRLLEAQINATHGDPIKTGSLYGIHKVNPAPHKPDEWFTQEVIARGRHIIIKVNGKVTTDLMLEKGQDPGKGHFALQGHDPGTVVKFRKVEVKEIK